MGLTRPTTRWDMSDKSRTDYAHAPIMLRSCAISVLGLCGFANPSSVTRSEANSVTLVSESDTSTFRLDVSSLIEQESQLASDLASGRSGPLALVLLSKGSIRNFELKCWQQMQLTLLQSYPCCSVLSQSWLAWSLG